MYIDKNHDKDIAQRAPLKREAPVPFRTPVVRRVPRRAPPTTSKLNEIFKNKSLNFAQGTGFHGGASHRRGYRLALWSWLASFIDALILVSASCVFIALFSMIVRTSIGGVLGSLIHSQQAAAHFAEVFFVFGWIYMIAIRSFMGYTIGEWSCDLRLGQPHERLQSGYVLRVALRSTLILLTGVITLPLLSLIIGRDIAGVLSGLRLFSLK